MSASAKPVEKVFKSLLAVVLAVSLCPLAQAGQAQAQETEENDSEASAVSMPVDESDAQPSGLDDDIAPQSAESSDPIVDWTTCGTARWMIDASGCLVIAPLEGEESGELEYWDYKRKAPWYSRRQAITSVKVDGHVAAQTTYSMFDGCSRLTSLDLSSLAASKVEDMSYMFRDCSRLTSLDLSGLDASSVTNMSYMFRDCSRLASLDLSGLDASSVTNMSYMFDGCSRLASLDLSSFDTSKVKYMSSMFSGCSRLVTIYASASFSTASATSSRDMFSGCSSLAGGSGTGYDSYDVSDTRARVDSPGAPGYFTDKSASAYAALYGDGSLVFQAGPEAEEGRGALVAAYPFHLSGTAGGTPPWSGAAARAKSASFSMRLAPSSMRGWFSGMSSLESVDLTNLDTSNMEDMSSMFRGCSSLASLDLSSLDTSKVTDMSSMFDGCSSLASLDLSSLDASKVTDMSSMFRGCSSLASLDLSSLDASKVTDMSSMFRGCSSLASLDLSSLDTSKVEDMSSMFSGCSSLVTIYASASFSTASATSSRDMFSGCSSLAGGSGTAYDSSKVSATRARVDSPGAPGYFTDKSASAYAALYGDGSLVFQAGPEAEEGRGALVAAYPFHLSGTAGGTPPWSGAAARAKSASFSMRLAPSSMRGWFSGMSSLESVDLTNLDASSVTDMSSMFSGCSSLASLDLSGLDTSKVTDMGYMFDGCSSLQSLGLSGLDASKVTRMSSMFDGCSSLASLDLSGLDTSKVTRMSSMFDGCSSLTTLDLSSLDASKVTDMSSMFDGCSSLTTLDLSSLDASKVTDMSSMFDGCSSLTTLDLSSLDASKVTDMSSMFRGCSRLASLDLSSLDTSNVIHMTSMFSGCSRLASLDLSSFDTSKVKYMSSMFSGCSRLVTIYASASFSTASATSSRDMFSGCSSLAGGSGTGYDSYDVSDTRARVDSPGAPGYFTDKSASAYAALYGDGSLVFQAGPEAEEGRGALVAAYPFHLSGTAGGTPPWSGAAARAKSASFSMRLAPSSMRGWFSGMSSLESVDLTNLDTSNMEDMSSMFRGCSSLASLDLSSLDTSKVTDMSSMFSGCSGLVTIYASASFSTASVTSSRDMFSGCSSLAGGSGTSYDSSYDGKARARIDAPGAPGYFTDKSASAYAALYGDGSLVFQAGPEAEEGRGALVAAYPFHLSGTAGGTPPWSGAAASAKSASFSMGLAPSSMRGWFSGMSSLESVDLTNLDTSKVEDMSSMFSGCSSLASLDLSSLDTSKVTDMSSMFSGCSGLVTIYASASFSTGSVTSSDGMFRGCSMLTGGSGTGCSRAYADKERARIDSPGAPGYFTDKSASAYAALYGDGSLVFQAGPEAEEGRGALVAAYPFNLSGNGSITPPWSGAAARAKSASFSMGLAPSSMRGWFSGMSSLESVDLTNLDTSKVTDMSSMFSGCSSLASLDLSSLDTSKVTDMSCMFRGCSSLQPLGLSSLDASKVTDMSCMFSGCSSLASLDLSSLDTSKVTDMSCMFRGCSRLTTLDLSSLDTSKVTDMSSMFSGCSSLASLDLSSLDTSKVTDMSYMFDMFSGCSSLASLDLSSLDTSKVEDMSSMFSGCSSLASLDLSSFDTSKVTDMTSMFDGCSSLASLDLSSFDTSNVTKMGFSRGRDGGMFYGCSSLTTLDLSSFDTSKVTDMTSMFEGCSRLVTIYASASFSTRSVKDSEDMFYGCSRLTGGFGTRCPNVNWSGTAYFDKSYACIDAPGEPGYFTDKDVAYAALYEDGELVFQAGADPEGGHGALSAAYPFRLSDGGAGKPSWSAAAGSVRSVSFSAALAPSSMRGWFSGMSSLESVDLTNLDTSKVTDMGLMFYGCSSLSSLDLSTFDTSKVTDMSSMFEGCSGLRSVSLGGRFSFSGATGSRLCSLPTPSGNEYSGLWESSADGEAYAPDEVPDNVAATYTARKVKTDLLEARASVSDIPDQTYTGSAIEPKVTVTLDGKKLVLGVDYTVSYANNVEVGTAVATIVGIGDYEGTIQKEFTIAAAPARTFPDVDYSSWYGDAVTFVSEKGLITGYDDTGLFGVGDTLTRAQLATILYRNANPGASPDERPWNTTGMRDVEGRAWYTAGVNWAVANGVINGYADEQGNRVAFGPDDPVTFEQLVTVLANLSAKEGDLPGKQELTELLNSFQDGWTVSTWARQSMAWAVRGGLVSGYDEPAGKYLRPAEDVARERVAVVLMRAFEMGILE